MSQLRIIFVYSVLQRLPIIKLIFFFRISKCRTDSADSSLNARDRLQNKNIIIWHLALFLRPEKRKPDYSYTRYVKKPDRTKRLHTAFLAKYEGDWAWLSGYQGNGLAPTFQDGAQVRPSSCPDQNRRQKETETMVCYLFCCQNIITNISGFLSVKENVSSFEIFKRSSLPHFV